MKLLRYDCVESPFTWEEMTQFDLQTIQAMLERPFSASDSDMPQQHNGGMSADLRGPMSQNMNSGDLLGSDEEDYMIGDLEKPHQIESVKTTGGGQLLDLSRMLEVKKK